MNDSQGPGPFPIHKQGDQLALLDALAAELDSLDLQQMAHLDWGQDAKEHLAQLHLIANRLTLPSPMRWHPAEVLELERWSEPGDVSDGQSPGRLHRRRAFACTALLVAQGDPANRLDIFGGNQTLIQLIESLDALRLRLDEEAASLLLWLIPRLGEIDRSEGDHAFMGLGLVYFALGLPTWSNADLTSLLDWLMAAEGAVAGRWKRRRAPDAVGQWLLAATIYNQRHEKWRRFGPKLLSRLQPRHDGEVAETVRLIAAMLSPDA